MSNVTFDEETQYVPTHAQAAAEEKQGSLIGLMYRLGIAKTKSDANVIMIGIIVVCVIMSGTMLVFVQPHSDPAHQAALSADAQRAAAYEQQHPPK